MPQSSGPISQGTAAERQFTDVLWRDRFGDEPGVLADMDGTAYALTLPSGSDIVSVGSATQVSLATVAGFAHRIPASSPDTSITIPAAVGTSRTDIIALRYDPSYTGLPGPVRLFRIAGSSASIPSYDSSPPGVEDLPLWAITRAPGQNLSQATAQRLYPRIAPTLHMASGVDLPTSSPLGTVVIQAGITWVRELVSGSPAWVRRTNNGGTSGVLAGSAPPAGTPLLTKTYYASVTLNNNGDGIVPFPGGAFPNGLVAVELTHYGPGNSPPSNMLIFIPWNATLAQTSVRCYGPNGVPFGGTGVVCVLTAIGW